MFVGRTEPLQQLQALLNRKEASVAVVYGRRRIGKTMLILKALEGSEFFLVEGLEDRPKSQQLRSFVQQIEESFGVDLSESRPLDWGEAFLLLYHQLKKKPMPVVLDEFQWLANYRREIVSELKMVWDVYISKLNGAKLVLCGSIASFMTTKVIRSKALYGRVDLMIHLKGFELAETTDLLDGRGFDEVLEAQICLGGVPKYLDVVSRAASIRLGILQEAFHENGFFPDEFDRIFVSHFGKRSGYREIINTLSKHYYGLTRKQLIAKAKLPNNGTTTTHLRNLEEAGFISSRIPFYESAPERIARFYLSDAFLRFYFRFIKPNLRKIKSGSTGRFQAEFFRSPDFVSWAGTAFEFVCFEHATVIAKLLGFGGVDYTFGPYFQGNEKAKRGQIDLAFDRADQVITLCEMKHRRKVVGTELISEVEKKIGLLQEKFPNRTIQPVLVSSGPISKALKDSMFFSKVIAAKDLVISIRQDP